MNWNFKTSIKVRLEICLEHKIYLNKAAIVHTHDVYISSFEDLFKRLQYINNRGHVAYIGNVFGLGWNFSNIKTIDFTKYYAHSVKMKYYDDCDLLIPDDMFAYAYHLFKPKPAVRKNTRIPGAKRKYHIGSYYRKFKYISTNRSNDILEYDDEFFEYKNLLKQRNFRKLPSDWDNEVPRQNFKNWKKYRANQYRG